MLSHFKHAVKQTLFRTGAYRLNGISNRYYVLPYHMVVNEPNGFYPATSILNFEKQIAHLAKNYKIVTLNEIVDRVRNRDSIRRCVAITFDDGFRDNYENAYPILRKVNVPATVFLATHCVETGAAPWFIKLRYVFMKTAKTDYQPVLNGKSISLQMRTKEEKYAASEIIMTYLKHCSDGERISLLNRLVEELGIRDFGGLDNLMLNWDQIREMSEHGISFGAHTVSHPVLAAIPIDEAEREISESKKTIEGRIGKPVGSFAYPFGKRDDYKPEIFPILERLQFRCAVTTETGINNYSTSPFELNRFVPWELSMTG
jgi:peptidoglycan/xylan/chitin deacetylase (PgdA/CDA1 family)